MKRIAVEERLRRLDDIVARLQSGEVGLDEALRLFEQGVEHLRVAEDAIAKAELRVEEILAGGASRRPGERAPEDRAGGESGAGAGADPRTESGAESGTESGAESGEESGADARTDTSTGPEGE